MIFSMKYVRQADLWKQKEADSNVLAFGERGMYNDLWR